MNDRKDRQKPDWLEEFEDLANAQLGDGSACDQVHPIVATWYHEVMAGDPPESRDSVWQAMQCLTTEIMSDAPQAVMEALANQDISEPLAEWVTELLLIGRAFQIALDSGRLDDL